MGRRLCSGGRYHLVDNSILVAALRTDHTRVWPRCLSMIICFFLSISLLSWWYEDGSSMHPSRQAPFFRQDHSTRDVKSSLASQILSSPGMLYMRDPFPRWHTLQLTNPPASDLILTPYPYRKHHIAGLGNLCFQFASSLGLSITSHRRFAFDTLHFDKLLAVFDIKMHSLTTIDGSIDRLQVLAGRAPAVYEPLYVPALAMTSSNFTLRGYLQSWKYFHPHALSELRQIFKFRPAILEAAKDRMRKAGGGNASVITVGVHVRRGDIVTDPQVVEHGHKAAPVEYFRRAIQYYFSRYPAVVFVVCTNDHVWTAKHLGGLPNLTILANDVSEFPGVDLCVLTLCDHLIQSTGTFGWWASYLNEIRRSPKDSNLLRVTYYADWPRKGSDFAKLFSAKDFFLPHWIPV